MYYKLYLQPLNLQTFISALDLASDMEKKNKDSWLSCIRLIFKYLELENLYKNYTNISTNKIMQYLQNFVCNFSVIKESVSFEIYLLICFSHLLAGK
jgi:hypothetical protein